MAKTLFYNWAQLEEDCVELSRTLIINDFKPDMIIPLSPSAEIIKIMLCNFFEISTTTPHIFNESAKLLYVDSISTPETYATIAKIKEQYPLNDIKYATLFERASEINPLDFSINVILWDIEKVEMPWEYFWKKP